MTQEISLNTAQFALLNPDIRVSATSTFNAQEAYENTFEDVLLDQVSKTHEQNQKNNEVKFYNLGAPAGFFLDNSLLEQMEAPEIESSSVSHNGFNPYMLEN